MAWTNEDGLVVKYGTERSAVNKTGGNAVSEIRTMVVDIDYSDIASVGSHISNINVDDAYIPAGAYIKSATLVVTTAFASGGLATLDIGLAQNDASTVIDADGIDAVIAVADLGAGAVVSCNGALVGGTAAIGSADGYVYFTTGTAAFTAGAGRLVIEYVVDGK